MSPEQVTSQPADARADVYSMGILIYEMLTGRCPFEGENPAELMRAHLVEPVPPPASLRPGLELEPELEAFFERALAKKRAERFADAREMLSAWEALPQPPARLRQPAAAPPSAEPSAPEGPSPGTPRLGAAKAPRARAMVALTVAVLVIGGGGLAFFASESPAPDETTASAPDDDTRALAPSPDEGLDELDPLDHIPPELEGELRKVSRGATLDASEVRALREYQSAHPEDVSASLLLAHDYALRGWSGGALDRYALVHERDRSARASRWFLEDLIGMTASKVHGERAAAMIEATYGEAALPAIGLALRDAALDPDARSRLEGLEARMAGGGS
jgi:hypothetical protein